jgi:DUF971 family protein
MAGLTAKTPTPTAVTAHQQSRVLEVGFDDGASFRIPFELMRVYSPSAEVRATARARKCCRPASATSAWTAWSRWATTRCKPTFSDGHDSGLFTWDYLYFLGSQQDELWRDYEARLAAAGASRDAEMPRPARRRRLRHALSRLRHHLCIEEGIAMMNSTHFGFQTVDETQKAGRCAACSTRSRRATT